MLYASTENPSHGWMRCKRCAKITPFVKYITLYDPRTDQPVGKIEPSQENRTICLLKRPHQHTCIPARNPVSFGVRLLMGI